MVVKHLFSSIPPNNTILLIESLLNQSNVASKVKHEIRNLLLIWLKQKYFYFDNVIYSISEGLIMLNPVLAVKFHRSYR